MPIAVISDVHGNLPALRAVLQDIERLGVAAIVACGDLVSGPAPAATLDALTALPCDFRSVRGNADRGAVEAFDGTAGEDTHADDIWTGAQLEQHHRDYLAALPATISMEIEGLGRVLFCHGSPRRDDEIVLESMEEDHLATVLEGVDADVVVCGNTHMQFDRSVGERRLVNVGSVGWAFGPPGAYWAVLGPDVELRRTTFDPVAAEAELRQLGCSWPRFDRFVERVLHHPLSREEAAAAFTSSAKAQGSTPGG